MRQSTINVVERIFMTSTTTYQAAFFIVPSRIMNLPGLTISYLKVYEAIFQFWNHGKNCFLSDKAIIEKTNLSERCVRDAYIFFESAKELKREKRGLKRYLIQPTLFCETDSDPVDNSPIGCTNSVNTGTSLPVDRHKLAGTTGTDVPHNKNKFNTMNLSKSFCSSEEQKKNNEKKHHFAEAKNEKASIAKNETFKKARMPDNLRQQMKKFGARL